MATYFHGSSEFQAASAPAPHDGLQTLYLMNPSYVPYSDTNQTPTNMFFLNPAGNALNHTSLPHAQPPTSHLMGLPLPPLSTAIGTTNQTDPGRHPPLHTTNMAPAFHYNLWGSNMDQNSSGSHHQIASAGSARGPQDVAPHLGLRPPPVASSARQGLSLSLSSHQVPYRSSTVEHDPIQGQSPIHAISIGEDMRVSGNSPSSVSVVSNGISGMQSAVLGSKYLRAAQELLDEVVNVGKGIKSDVSEGTKEKIKKNKESVAVGGEGSSGGENGAKRGAELTTSQRQELQMKKAKLISMLDEVEQRYRQYHHQIQIVISSFEQVAGLGSAKSYTALALQTISKQFRCLKDTITGQIKATSSSLGEEDCLGVKVEGSRLRYVDHQLRQQRALQQLGMIQHNAWRPQRGLPERAVSVLRAWLFEHFLHPYPKDADKLMLAKQTGLTRSQVSNWFINARVRLWKPMVEEMYLEEMKEQEQNGTEENSNKNERKESGSSSTAQKDNSSQKLDQARTKSKPQNTINHNTSTAEFSNSTVSMSPVGGAIQPQTAFNLIGSSDMEGFAQRSSKKPRNNDMQNSPSSILSMDMDMKQSETSFKFADERLSKNGYGLVTGGTNHGGGFGAFPMGEIGRFNPEELAPTFPGNGVSLTLGLPHCENLSLSAGNQQSFLSNQNIPLGRRLELGGDESDFCGIATAQPSHSSTGYESIEMQNRKRFVAQLLPDFVA